MQFFLLNIIKKILIFLAPVIINWIWEKKIMKKKNNPKGFDKKNVINGKILR